MRLTDRSVARLSSGRPRGQRFHDDDLPGFFCAVFPSGRKVFGVRYGPENRRRQLKIGPFGPLSVKQARAEAKRVLGKIALGVNPAEESRAASGGTTFKVWRETYLSRIKDRKKTAWQDERYLRMAGQVWDSRLLTEISREDVEIILASHSGTPIQANRLLASVRACLEEARRSGIIPRNPAWDVKAYPENPPRSRVLSQDEMRAVLLALETEQDTFARAAIRILIETGARQSEVLNARWDDLNLDEGIWRLPRTKSGPQQFLPLARSTVRVLREIPHRGPFVIVGRSPNRRRHDLRGPWKRIRSLALEGKNVTLHDVRRTFGLSVARAAGVLIASRLLRHSDIRVTARVYAPLGVEELRSAVEGRSEEVRALFR